jgi:hypothetical protein
VRIGNFLHRDLAPDDRFARVRKVMVRLVARLLAGGYGLGDRLLETAPVLVAQERLEVASAPVLRAVLVLWPLAGNA